MSSTAYMIYATVLYCTVLVFEKSSAYENTFFGALQPFTSRPSQVTRVKIPCLHTVAPPPFNYKFKCPDTANISDWRDKQGAFHRLIEHEPIKGVTSDMLRWWFSPALAIFSPLVPFRGEMVYWYKLWHPIDHHAVIPAPGLSPDHPKIPALWVIVSESYRKTKEENHPQEYDIHAATFVGDSRFGIQIRLPGGIVLASFLNHFWWDSPEGLRCATEFIVGSSAPIIGPILNHLAVDPVVNNQFVGLADQVARHHIEEMGAFSDFLPELYDMYNPGLKKKSDAYSESTGMNRTEAAYNLYPYNKPLEKQAEVTGTKNAQVVGEKEG